MAKEIWKLVPGYQGRFKVSNRGRVIILWRKRGNRWWKKQGEKKFVIDRTPRLVIGCEQGGGYWSVCGRIYVHLLVAAAFLGPCPKGKEINHKNGIKNDNRVENLEYVTHRANIQHAWDTGLCKPYWLGKKGQDHCSYGKPGCCGEKNGRAQLTWEKVRQIRAEGRWGTNREIGKKWGVNSEAIRNILLGRKWIEGSQA